MRYALLLIGLAFIHNDLSGQWNNSLNVLPPFRITHSVVTDSVIHINGIDHVVIITDHSESCTDRIIQMDDSLENGYYVLICSSKVSASLIASFQILNGKYSGEWTNYHPNNVKSLVINYVNGIEEGYTFQYDHHGTLLCKTPYKAGKKDGIELHYKNGKIVFKAKFSNDILIHPKNLRDYIKQTN